MSCHEAGAHLSPYYDRQLSGELQQAVAAHVGVCHSCRHELETFECLSNFTESSFTQVEELDLQSLQAPTDLWSRIERSLQKVSESTLQSAVVSPANGVSLETRHSEAAHPEHGHAKSRHAKGRFRWHQVWTRWERGPRWQGAALAALLLIAVGTGLFWFQGRMEHHYPLQKHPPQGRLAHYINTFVRDTGAAQRILVSDYGAQRVDLQEASRRLGYQPVIPGHLPEGYSLEAIYVFELDCCNCAQYVCYRGEAEPITIFEHANVDAAHLAGCPTRETVCRGQRCQLAQMGKDWIASWQVGPRQITVVGAQNVKEVEQLITHFSQLKSSKTGQGA